MISTINSGDHNKIKDLLKTFPYLIALIDDPDEDIQLLAVKKDLMSIEFIYKPTKEVEMYVVKTKSNLIKYITIPDKDIQLVAVKDDPNNIEFIRNSHPEVIDYLKENFKVKKSRKKQIC